MIRRVRIVVRGRVHGVGFRACTQATATQLGVTGYVRNRPDGTAEIEAEGARANLDRLIAWCRTGPSMARVDSLEVEESVPAGEWTDFQVR